MKIVGIEALVPKPSLSAPNKKHKVVTPIFYET